jgi:hypothetical protein
MNAWATPAPYTLQPIDAQTLALRREPWEARERRSNCNIKKPQVLFGRGWRRVTSIGRLLPPSCKVRGYGFNDQVARFLSWRRSRASRWRSNSRAACRADGDSLARSPDSGGDGRHRGGPTRRPPGETFAYCFNPPDARSFWYTRTPRKTKQVEKGLHAALIVRPAGSS